MSGLLEDTLREIEIERKNYELATFHDGFSVAELRAAFDKIADATNWKNPIEAVIEEGDFELCSAAVGFFTGSELKKISAWDESRLIVRADGYYATCGA